MDTDDLTPQPQGHAPASRLTWALRGITSVLVMSVIGLWLSAFPGLAHDVHLQIIGSGWWQDGAMGISGLLLALAVFSAKVSALVTRREPGIQWLSRIRLRDVITEMLGLAIFVGYGVLPLSIHGFNSWWTMLVWWGVFGGWLISQARPIRRRVEAIIGAVRNDVESLVADPSQLSRRAFISGALILGIGAPGLAVLWRALPTLIPEYTFFGHDDTVSSLSWFPDGRRIASIGWSGQVLIWNADDGSSQRMLARIGSGLSKMQVSPNGKLIVVSDYGLFSVVDASTGKLLWRIDTQYGEFQFSWAPDSTQMVVLSDSQVMIRDALTGGETTTTFVPPGNFTPQAVAWSPHGQSIAVTDGVYIVMWDAASGAQRDIYTLPVATRDEVSDFAWSPDGHALAVALRRVVYVWSLNNAAAPIAYREFSNEELLISASWSPDGRYIASRCSLERTVRVWEATTGKTAFVYNGHFSSVAVVAWSPDGQRIASGGFDNLVHVWRPILPA